tara:strand:- start:274 stop:561 length:288 start_codon:yes stop_codon:yes gene_type:complete
MIGETCAYLEMGLGHLNGGGICKENVIFHVGNVETTSGEKLKELVVLFSEKEHGSTVKREQRGCTSINFNGAGASYGEGLARQPIAPFFSLHHPS